MCPKGANGGSASLVVFKSLAACLSLPMAIFKLSSVCASCGSVLAISKLLSACFLRWLSAHSYIELTVCVSEWWLSADGDIEMIVGVA